MNSLDMKISELKKNLMDINIKAIKKNKLKPVKINSENHKDLYLLKIYNYHVKLTKRLKTYMEKNLNSEIIFKMIKDRFDNIICIAINIEKNIIDIGVPVEIKAITGNEYGAFLSCTYYNELLGGRLYLNDFRSSIPKHGYGSIILKNLDELILILNEVLIHLGYEVITLIEGKMIPNTNIISREALKKIYLKFGFSIDSNNNLKRTVESKKLEVFSY